MAGAMPLADETVQLFDVVVDSLENESDRERCARTLISLKRAPTIENAIEQLEHLPYPLFSHLSEEEAKNYERLLKVSGVPGKVQASVLTCPYCSFSAQLQGKSAERGDGVFYTCYSCNRRFFLSFRNHYCHMLLECTVCGNLLRLPLQPRIGRYKCACGTMIDYLGGGRVAPPPRAARPGRETVKALHKAATTVEPEFVCKPVAEESRTPWATYAAIFVLIAAIFFLGLMLGSVREIVGLRSDRGANAQDNLDPKIKRFTADTAYEEIVGTLGPPSRISLAANGTDKNLVYSHRGYYIVVTPGASGRELYRGTYRLSDDAPLHRAAPPGTAP